MVAVPAADVVDELVFCGHRWRFRLELTEEQERLANYHRFAQVSEQIVAVNEAICEARPPNPAATAPPAGTTGHKKGGSATRSRRSSPPS